MAREWGNPGLDRPAAPPICSSNSLCGIAIHNRPVIRSLIPSLYSAAAAPWNASCKRRITENQDNGERRESRKMGAWVVETTILRMTAVILVLILVRKAGRRKRTLIASLAAAAVAVSVYVLREGVTGLVFALAGAATALVICIPLIFRGRVSRADAATFTAAGAIFGSIGTLAAVAVILALSGIRGLIARGRRGHTRSLGDDPGAGASPAEDILPVTGVERRRMERKEPVREALAAACEDGCESPSLRVEFAVAAMFVLITGVFV